MRKKEYFFYFFLLVILLLISGCALKYSSREVTYEESKKALEFALKQIGKPYVYGGQDPKMGFDCSGLVIWSYQQVIPNAMFFNNGKLYPDATVEALYNENTRHIEIDELREGDIVFFADEENNIEHCGLYVERTNENNIKVIHASGGLNKVVLEECNPNEPLRGYHIWGFGRLIVSLVLR